ncbi:MAG: glyoxalase [Gammaproteobacteria bacterium]|nr:glyoxalase [Gammaproteobacteria bacterium]MYD76963.1 glyoxalase [Gammaproteobacteria bacterium]MYJ52676.1 glyoxalase [Gammaproteobacteria bacterium]
MSGLDPNDAVQVGHALEGFGVNLLVSGVERTTVFLQQVFGFSTLSCSRDYSLLSHGGILFQLHADHTYSKNPLPSLLPEFGARGGGVELRLFDVDPDEAERRAREGGYEVLMETADKPHGLRECFLLDPDGYCWCPSVRI